MPCSAEKSVVQKKVFQLEMDVELEVPLGVRPRWIMTLSNVVGSVTVLDFGFMFGRATKRASSLQ